MSFLEHLEELRKRLILALGGLGVAFVVSLSFSEQLWNDRAGTRRRRAQVSRLQGRDRS